MSKSRGNVLYADDLVEEFGLDQIRYYILSSMPLNSDGLISRDLIIEKINSDLSNNIGNLVNRTISMSIKYFEGKVNKPSKAYPEDEKFIKEVEKLSKISIKYFEEINISLALSTIIDISRMTNKYIDDNSPWILAKEENKTRLEAVIFNILESIRIISVLLEPFIPSTSTKILDSLNTKYNNYESIEVFGEKEEQYMVKKTDILFARVDKE